MTIGSEISVISDQEMDLPTTSPSIRKRAVNPIRTLSAR